MLIWNTYSTYYYIPSISHYLLRSRHLPSLPSTPFPLLPSLLLSQMDTYKPIATALLSKFSQGDIFSRCIKNKRVLSILNFMKLDPRRYDDDFLVALSIQVNTDTMKTPKFSETIAQWDDELGGFEYVEINRTAAGKRVIAGAGEFLTGEIPLRITKPRDVNYFYQHDHLDIQSLIEEEGKGVSHVRGSVYDVFYIFSMEDIKKFLSDHKLVSVWRNVKTQYKSIALEEAKDSIKELVKINTIHCGGVMPIELINIISREIVTSYTH